MNLAQLAWSYLRARPLGTLLNVLLLALGVGTIGFVLIVDGAGRRQPQSRRPRHRSRRRRQGQPDPADPRRGSFTSTCRPATSRSRPCDELAANPLVKRVIPDVDRGQLSRLLDPRDDARLRRPLRRHVRVGSDLDATRCRPCWARPSPRARSSASATASSVRTGLPKAARCTAIRSTPSSAC